MAKRSREDLKLEDQQYDSDTSINTVDTSASLVSAPKSKRFDPDEDDDFDLVVIRCSLPGHPQNLPFHSLESYETHYTRMHIGRCAECRAVLPSAHMLSLHQREYHDPFFAILKEKNEQAEKGGKRSDPPIQPIQPRPSHLLPPQSSHKLQPTQCCQPSHLPQPSEKPDKERIYACFDHMCDKMCSSARKRKMHLIDKHGYPRDYEFRIVEWGIEGRSSLLREPKGKGRDGGGRRRSLTLEKKTEGKNEKKTSENEEDGAEKMDVDDDLKYPAPPEAMPAIREAARAQLSAVVTAKMPALAKQPRALVEAKASEDAMDIDGLAGAMSALRFVPTSVRLGKAQARPSKN